MEWVHRAGALTLLLSMLVACSPGGPSCAELAASPIFATAMPDTTAGGSYCSDPRGGIEGPSFGFAMQVFGTDQEPAAVLEWHRATFESEGWTTTRERPITLHDGHPPEAAWRKGDLIVGLGMLHRDNIGSDPTAGVPGRTVYEVFITYRPSATPRSAP